jgi:hypothetical protein
MTLLRSFVLALLVAVLAAVMVLAEDAPKDKEARVDIASRSTLNDATALANKNTVATDNNIAMMRSNAVMQQNDVIDLAQEAAGQLPEGLTLTGEQEDLVKPDGVPHEMFYGYRRRFFYPRFHGGYWGWRYPMGYWNFYGPRFYGSFCPFGRRYGGFYYC